ncbi:MAG: hypothetical protein IJO24_07445 [Clostridia bacterium]|nr:hypothetical protein [Clostridia bacterium]
MSKSIIRPNLPEGRVKTAIMGNHPEIAEMLRKIGIDILTSADNLSVDFSVRNHADMAACYLGNGRIIVDRGQERLIRALEETGITVIPTEKAVTGRYPDDVGLNCALIGNNIICNPKTSNRIILEENADKRLFSVKQGYCRCSVCPVTENAIITDDIGICNKVKNSLDVLLIEKGDILLEGKDYGFIGGASAKIDRNTICFFGDLSTHRSACEIQRFLANHGVKHINLSEGSLRDIGGIVALTETE